GSGLGVGDGTEPNAVVVSATLARHFFPGENPIGRTIQRLEPNGQPVEMFASAAKAFGPAPPWTIVGVVADVREQSLRLAPTEIVYVPVRNPPVERSIVPTSMTLVVRSDLAAVSVAAGVRRVIREIEPAISVARVR